MTEALTIYALQNAGRQCFQEREKLDGLLKERKRLLVSNPPHNLSLCSNVLGSCHEASNCAIEPAMGVIFSVS
jgi:hypothetical protein